MPHNEETAERIRTLIKRRKGITERKMFGGVAFMYDGNMVCGVTESDLMVRLGNEGAAEALEEPWVRAMDFTGRVIKSMVYVAPESFEDDEELRAWINRAINFAKTLPPK